MNIGKIKRIINPFESLLVTEVKPTIVSNKDGPTFSVKCPECNCSLVLSKPEVNKLLKRTKGEYYMAAYERIVRLIRQDKKNLRKQVK